MSEKRLDFSHNWNNKLYCDYFTSLRLSGRFVVGDKITTFLKKELIGLVEVVGKKEIRLAQINDWVGMLDTGYPAAETQNILRTMYPEVPDWATQPIFYYMFHRTSALFSLPPKPVPTATLNLFTQPNLEGYGIHFTKSTDNTMDLFKISAIISAYTPETAILDEMEKALKEYRANPNDDTRQALTTFSTVWLQKIAIDRNAEGLNGVLKDIEGLDKMKTAFDHTKKQS